MNDLISRQAAIDVVYWWYKHTWGEDAKGNICESLKNLPSAEPERKKGKWLRYGEDGYPNEVDTTTWQCDQCLETYYGRTTRIPNFCPNCGSEMRGEE